MIDFRKRDKGKAINVSVEGSHFRCLYDYGFCMDDIQFFRVSSLSAQIPYTTIEGRCKFIVDDDYEWQLEQIHVLERYYENVDQAKLVLFKNIRRSVLLKTALKTRLFPTNKEAQAVVLDTCGVSSVEEYKNQLRAYVDRGGMFGPMALLDDEQTGKAIELLTAWMRYGNDDLERV